MGEHATALEVVPRADLARSETTDPAALVHLALTRGADPGTLERLMALAERWEAQQAQRALVAALAEFKAACPSVIRRDAEVRFGNTHYRHASLGEMLSTVTPHLSAAGLTLTFEAEQEGGALTVWAVLEHVRGGRRLVPLRCPPDSSGQKNAIQQIASAATYAKRHATALILGLSEIDDDDGQGGAPRPRKPPTDQAAPKQTLPPTVRPDPPAQPASEKRWPQDFGSTPPAGTPKAQQAAGPTVLQLERLQSLRGEAQAFRADAIDSMAAQALADSERGALSEARAGACIGQCKAGLTRLGWQEPEEWGEARKERRRLAKAEDFELATAGQAAALIVLSLAANGMPRAKTIAAALQAAIEKAEANRLELHAAAALIKRARKALVGAGWVPPAPAAEPWWELGEVEPDPGEPPEPPREREPGEEG